MLIVAPVPHDVMDFEPKPAHKQVVQLAEGDQIEVMVNGEIIFSHTSQWPERMHIQEYHPRERERSLIGRLD